MSNSTAGAAQCVLGEISADGGDRHTDFGTTTLLFSVPITCLQIWGRDQVWRYVKYNPGSLVVNIGDTLERMCSLFMPKEDEYANNW